MDSRIRQIERVAEAIIPEPKDVEVRFVALQQVFVRKAVETFRFDTLMTIRGVVASDEVVQIRTSQRVRLQREMLVGTKIVNPERVRPRFLASGLAVEEEHISLHTLGIENTRGQAQQRVDIAIVQ